MNDKIEDFGVSALSYMDLIDYTGQAVALLMHDPAIEHDAGVKLETARNNFIEGVNTQKLGATISLKEVDRENEVRWRNTKLIVKAAVTHPDPEARNAALEIEKVFKKCGDPTRARYSLSYGIIGSVLAALRTIGEDKLRLALVFPWYQSLLDGYNAFQSLRMKKSLARAESESGINAMLHDQLCKCYTSIIERLNAITLLQPDDDRIALAQRFNRMIADFRTGLKLGRHKSDKDGEDDVSLPIDAQGVSTDLEDEDNQILDALEEEDLQTNQNR